MPLLNCLFTFAKLILYQLRESVKALSFVWAVGLQRHFRALARGQHHDAHDRFRIHAPLVAGHPDFALVFGRELRQFGGSPCMQAQLIDDFDFLFDHIVVLVGGRVQYRLGGRWLDPALLSIWGKANPIIHADGAALSTGQRHLDHDVDRIVAIRDRTQQHWQTDAGDNFHMSRLR